MITTDPTDSRLKETKPDGQQSAYLVLSEEERAKGFVRPYRDTYKHVGKQSQYSLRDMTPEEHERYDQYGYVKFETYPESHSPVTGRYWTQKELDTKYCGAVTTMGRALSETYARDPKFYGGTYCVGCGAHFPVSEFIWDDGSVVGS